MDRQQTEQEVTHLVDEWAAAELRADIPFLERTLADDFVGIGPLGFMLNRSEWLERHRSGELKYSAFTVDDVSVRVYSGATLVTCRQTQQATYRGTPVPGEFRASLMFVDQDGQWRLAGLQLSAMRQFQPPAPGQS